MAILKIIIAAAACAAPFAAATSRSRAEAAYQQHRRQFNTTLDSGVDYDKRLNLFTTTLQLVETHNAKADKLWEATAYNKFADWTPDELSRLYGYSRHADWVQASQAAQSVRPRVASFLQMESQHNVGASIDWLSFSSVPEPIAGANLTTLHLLGDLHVQEQGACGSCWAVAASHVMAIHLVIDHAKRNVPLKQVMNPSFEQIVECTPNPRHCGGEGGCSGATAELAFDWASKFSVTSDALYEGYKQSGDKCKMEPSVYSARVLAYQRFPENRASEVLQFLYEKGPVVVSLDASEWSYYRSGVFDGCKKDATVNHAVAMYAFGVDTTVRAGAAVKYWTIRNSWGASWGDGGSMRLQRHDDQDEPYCGVDRNPQVGVGCDGGPPSIPVCGMCGILSDVSAPKGVQLNAGDDAPAEGAYAEAVTIRKQFRLRRKS